MKTPFLLYTNLAHCTPNPRPQHGPRVGPLFPASGMLVYSPRLKGGGGGVQAPVTIQGHGLGRAGSPNSKGNSGPAYSDSENLKPNGPPAPLGWPPDATGHNSPSFHRPGFTQEPGLQVQFPLTTPARYFWNDGLVFNYLQAPTGRKHRARRPVAPGPSSSIRTRTDPRHAPQGHLIRGSITAQIVHV